MAQGVRKTGYTRDDSKRAEVPGPSKFWQKSLQLPLSKVIHSLQNDLGPKTAAMLHIAAAIPAYSLANDTTYYGLQDDILTESLQIHNGRMTVPRAPGLGVTGDPQRINRYRVE